MIGWDADVVPWKQYQGTGAQGGNPVQATSGMTTSILPNEFILFGEHTHSIASINESGIETGEIYSPVDSRNRMGEDVRIPRVSGVSGGNCSKLTITINSEQTIASGVKELYTNIVPGSNNSTGASKYYLEVVGGFGGQIDDWLNGQVAFKNASGDVVFNSNSPRFVQREASFYENSEGKRVEFIEISGTTNAPDKSNINLMGRTVKMESRRIAPEPQNNSKIKLFNFDVYPLYLVGKLKDKAQINNISITETTATTKRTISPVLSISRFNSEGFIDNANGNVINDSTPPTNFIENDNLSSALIDVQNLQVLRDEKVGGESVTKDTFYVGENQTKEIDLTKVFGNDRNVITPDNNNVEATFFTAKQISPDDGSSKFTQASINYREQ